MPSYRDNSGHTVHFSTALDNVGRVRPGFHKVLDDGEAAHFSLSMRDAAPSRSNAVYLMDGSQDPEAEYAAAQARLSDSRRSAWKNPANSTTLSDAEPPRANFADAEADFAAQQARLSDERGNAWKKG